MVKVSIITTAFNAAGTISDCLDSIKGQTHEAVEHIVVDAASTDGTLDILEAYKDSLAGVVSGPDNGIYDGMNKGLRLATGDVIGILNADDMYPGPDVLAQVVRVFEDERVCSCYGDLVYIAESDDSSEGNIRGFDVEEIKIVRYWKSGDFDQKKFYWGWMPPHPTFFVRSSMYEKYGYFNLELGTAADYELMLRFLVKHEISAAYIPEVLVKMRSGGASNVTLKSRLQANRMDRNAWAVNGLRPYPWTLLMKPLRKAKQWVLRPSS